MRRPWCQVVTASSSPLLGHRGRRPGRGRRLRRRGAVELGALRRHQRGGALVSLVLGEELIGHRIDVRRTPATAGGIWALCLAALGVVVLPLTALRMLPASALVAAAAAATVLAWTRHRLGLARDAWDEPVQFATQAHRWQPVVASEVTDEQLC